MDTGTIPSKTLREADDVFRAHRARRAPSRGRVDDRLDVPGRAATDHHQDMPVCVSLLERQ